MAKHVVPETLGGRLKQIRAHKLFSQGELAALAGVTRTTIARVEQGKSGAIHSGTAQRLATALGVEVSWLLSSDQERE